MITQGMPESQIVKNPEERWYPCICSTCGWIGSSEYCGTDGGISEDTDVYCPQCGSSNTDEYEHEHYPISYFVTGLISRFKAWRIRTSEEKYWESRIKGREL